MGFSTHGLAENHQRIAIYNHWYVTFLLLTPVAFFSEILILGILILGILILGILVLGILDLEIFALTASTHPLTNRIA
jgi:hypothetical protein